jgi:hypothetical protein
MVQSNPIALTKIAAYRAKKMPKLGRDAFPSDASLSKDGTTVICPPHPEKPASLYSPDINPEDIQGDIPPKLTKHLIKVEHPNGDCEMIDPYTG